MIAAKLIYGLKTAWKPVYALSATVHVAPGALG